MVTAYPRLLEARRAFEDNHYVEAAQLAIAHLRAHPREPRGLALLGTAAMRMGALGQGEEFLRQSVSIAPERPAMRELASCLNQQEKLPDALEQFQRLEASGDTDPLVLLMIALILDKLGRPDEARQKLEALLERHPADQSALLAYALNLRADGRTEEAIEVYRRITTADPERGDAWWGMASIKRQVFSDEDIAAMEEGLRTAIDISNKAPLNFALGRAWHERKDFAKAFHHFSEANQLWAEWINYQPHELSDEVDETQRLFDRAYFRDERPGGDPSDAPIFIVSLPRSGSTLLEQMLGSHPDVEALGELPHVPALVRSIMEAAQRQKIETVPQACRALSPSERTALGAEYVRRAGFHRKTGAPRFIDKLPHNWSNSLLIHLMLPSARIVDIRRGPLDCCFSNFTHSFTRVHSASFALKDIGRAYVDYVRYMDHLDHAAPGMIHHVRYEDLIAEPERVLRGVFDYLGLPWDEAVLRFYKSDRVVRTPSAEQVRRPLNREGLGIWEPYDQWLGPLRDALGPLADD